ncbi:MAG: rhombotarget lipoprotein [Pseudomonadales bacterium]
MRLSLISALLLALSGCTAFWQTLSGDAPRQGESSSLVDFLYPDGETPPAADDRVPVLNVPLRVGLAFVPSNRPSSLPEATKVALLEQARQRFLGQDYVADIVIVPETYLTGRRGFDALDQIARLYGLDVMALVSYDQVSIAEDRTSSLLYWTIVGAYVIKGTSNDVHTFVDTAVFDLKTRKLLLRAPGTSELTTTSTLVRSGEQGREARTRGFDEAMAAMTDNLAVELERFRARIKEDRSVLVADRRGGGTAGWLLLGVLGVAAWWSRRRGG